MNASPGILMIAGRPRDLPALRAALQPVAAEIVEAPDVNAACRLARHRDFALAILDVRLPPLDNCEPAEILRGDARTRNLPLIVLCANTAEQEQILETDDTGAVDCLVQPYSPARLRARVNIFLRMARQRAATDACDRRIEQEVCQRTAQLREDIAGHERTHQALRVREADARGIIADNVDGIVIVDRDGTVRLVNRAAEDLFGAAAQQLVGSRLDFDIVVGDRAEKTFPRPGAPSVITEMRVSEVTWEGRICRLAAFRDITSRKQAEERQVLMATVLAVLNRRNDTERLIEDILGLIHDWSGFDAAAVRLREGNDFPYSVTRGMSSEFVAEERYLCRQNADGTQRPRCFCGRVICGTPNGFAAYFTAGGSFWTNDMLAAVAAVKAAEGAAGLRGGCVRKGYHSAALVPLRAGDETVGLLQLDDRRPGMLSLDMIEFLEHMGASIGIAVRQMQDDAERHTMEAQLRQAQKLEAIGTLASGVAHEINNPINGIMNYAQLISDAIPDGAVNEYAGEIIVETERVAALVRNLLSFARKDDAATLHRAGIDREIDATLSLVRAIMCKEHIDLHVDVPAALPPVMCRGAQLQQVIMNLVTNARDALNERYPDQHADKSIRITARPIRRHGAPWVRITVADHGVGIDDSIRERIFDPFFTTKGRTKGTGLGLSISHAIVTDHGGRLHVESSPTAGTCFHVDLPVDGPTAATSDDT